MKCTKCDILDPIRKVRVYSGKFKGWHYIYCSEKLFRKHNPDYKDEIITPYWEAKPGQWVFADDGFVIQLLDTYELLNKYYMNKESTKPDTGYTKVFVFPTRMARVYIRKDGTINANRFIANYIPLYRNHISDNYNPLGKYMSEKKRQFVMYLAAGLPPSIAYMKAYKTNYSLARSRGYRLAMQDETVIEELKKRVNMNILDDLEKIGLTGEALLNELKQMITSESTPAQVKRDLLLTVLRIKYKLNKDYEPLQSQESKQLPAAVITIDNRSQLASDLVNRLNEKNQ